MRIWLKDIRQINGMTLADVASKVGISVNAYFMIEKGERNPKVDTAQKIARVLKFNWTKFFPEKKGA